MKLIIGLGNPGKKYDNTRHNVGFSMLDFIFDSWLKAEGFSAFSDNKKFQAEISEGSLNDEKIILAKPLTFMNLSGEAVSAVATFYKINPENIIVLQDDIDLLLGAYKIQQSRSSAGHHGIDSIIEKLGTKDFFRVRIGIAKKNREEQGDAADFVLNKFTASERATLKTVKSEILEDLKKLL